MGLTASRTTEATSHRNEAIQIVADQVGENSTKHEIAIKRQIMVLLLILVSILKPY
jgi:hypothetical protein